MEIIEEIIDNVEVPKKYQCLHGKEKYYCRKCGGSGICENIQIIIMLKILLKII
jgi:hypothetical protein